jgi:hypothetical protein
VSSAAAARRVSRDRVFIGGEAMIFLSACKHNFDIAGLHHPRHCGGGGVAGLGGDEWCPLFHRHV